MLSDSIQKHPRITVLFFLIILLVIIAGSIVVYFNQNTSNSQNSSQGPDEDSPLPYSNFLYSISAPVNNTITINAYQGYRNAAITQLYNSGINPTNYKIVFNYKNPFTPYE